MSVKSSEKKIVLKNWEFPPYRCPRSNIRLEQLRTTVVSSEEGCAWCTLPIFVHFVLSELAVGHLYHLYHLYLVKKECPCFLFSAWPSAGSMCPSCGLASNDPKSFDPKDPDSFESAFDPFALELFLSFEVLFSWRPRCIFLTKMTCQWQSKPENLRNPKNPQRKEG